MMKYQMIGREKEKNLQALTWNGTMTPHTMTAPHAFRSEDTLKEPLSDLATSAWPNLSYRPTSIVEFTMEQKYKWPQRK